METAETRCTPSMSDFNELQKQAIVIALSRISGNVPRALAMMLDFDIVALDMQTRNQQAHYVVHRTPAKHGVGVPKSDFADALRAIGRELEIEALVALADEVESGAKELERRGQRDVFDTLHTEREMITVALEAKVAQQ